MAVDKNEPSHTGKSPGLPNTRRRHRFRRRLARLGDYGGFKVDSLFDERMLPVANIRLEAITAILNIARFCVLKSELHRENTKFHRTALNDQIGVPVAKGHTVRLHAGLDRLLPLKQAIENHLQKRLRQLFHFGYDLLSYDISSTYFEGEATPRQGRLIVKNWRTSRAFRLRIEKLIDSVAKARLHLNYELDRPMAVMVGFVAGMPSVANESGRHVAPGSVEALHTVGRSGMGVPNRDG